MLGINKQYNNKVKNLSEEDRIIEMIGSTEDHDRIGDKMYMSGVKLDNYLKNPVILANHSYGEAEKPTVIGKALDVRVEGDKLIFKIKFAETENAKDWYHLYANGYMNASSIGFTGIKSKPNNYGGYDYYEWELLELSLVAVPCNQNAIQHAFNEGQITKSMFNIIKGVPMEKEKLENEETEVEETEVETEETVETETTEASENNEDQEGSEEETETEESEEVEDKEPEEKVCTEDEDKSVEEAEESETEEPKKPVNKSIKEERKINRKIKFVKDGGNEMNKYEQFKEYCTTKALTGGASSGQAVLPVDFVNDVIDRIKKDPVALRNLVHVYPTTLRTGKIPVTKTAISADWAASDAAFPEKDFAFEDISFAISDLLAYTKISNDLIADTPVNLYNELLRQVVIVITQMENASIISGNGTNKPKGIIGTSEVKAITLEAAMTADDIVGLPYEVDVTWRQNGMFIVPTELMKAIRLMKDTNGQYLFTKGSVVNGAPDTLAGYPVVELASVGEKQIIFGDLSQYYLIDRQQLVVEMDSSVAFTENKTTVRFGERIDGKVGVPAAFVILNQQA